MMSPEIVRALKGPTLGVGARSFVYAVDNDWVVKRMTDECDGFHAIVGMGPKFAERFSLPRIDYARSDIDEGIIVIERLYRSDWDYWEGSDDVHNHMNDLHHNPDVLGKNFKVEDFLENDHPLYDITLKAFKAWKLLRRIGWHVSIDLNPSNIMVRTNGELVLSDPFGYLDI